MPGNLGEEGRCMEAAAVLSHGRSAGFDTPIAHRFRCRSEGVFVPLTGFRGVDQVGKVRKECAGRDADGKVSALVGSE